MYATTIEGIQNALPGERQPGYLALEPYVHVFGYLQFFVRLDVNHANLF